MNQHKILLLYTWLIRVALFFLPDLPFIMRFRGWLYSLGMNKCGKNFQVAHNVIINSLEGFSVGNNVYLAMNSVFYTNYSVTLGDEVMFGPGCLLTCGNHTFLNNSFRYGLSDNKEITIGDGCWVAGHCVILPGASLPNRSILAAGAILTHHLDTLSEDSIYAGVPARFLKKRL